MGRRVFDQRFCRILSSQTMVKLDQNWNWSLPMQQACFSPVLLPGYASRILFMYVPSASVRKGERRFCPFPGRESTHKLAINGH